MNPHRFRLPLFLVLLIGFVAFCVVRWARAAEQLAPAAAPTDWTGLWIALGLGIIVGVAILLHRKFPTAAAKADSELKQTSVDVGHRIADALEKLVAKAPAPAAIAPVAQPEAAAPAVPPPPPGHNGQPGLFSITVTGDPKVDLAAITAAYYS